MFLPTEIEQVYECADCGRRTNPTGSPPERIRCICGSNGAGSRVPCAHLGKLARMAVCSSCNGNVRLKVYACAVHDECSIGQPVEALPCCASCDDRTDAPGALASPLEDRLAIAVITAPRQPATLESTLESLRLAGFAQPVQVFEDRDANQVANWRRAARWLLDNTTAEWLLITEDDVEFCHSAADALAAAVSASSSLHMLSLYTPAHHAADRSRVGWQSFHPSDDTRGALAWCFDRMTLEPLHAALEKWDRPEGLDRAIGRELAAMHVDTRQHVPSLARHTGGESSSMGHRHGPKSEAVGYRPDYEGYRRDHATRLPGRLAAITARFDPAGAAIFETNHRRFAASLQRQGVALFAEIGERLPPEARLWQKERLLNEVVRRLPEEVDKVVWLDADVLFEDSDWPDKTAALLERFPVVQPWSQVIHLDRDGHDTDRIEYSAAAVVGRHLDEFPHPGFAWAARRDVLERHALYDRHPVGAGDAFWAWACFGEFGHEVLSRHNDAMQRSFRRWALPVFAEIRGDVGHLDGTIRHLWHGEPRNRRYMERLAALVDFDPDVDLKLGSAGNYVWATDKPRLHAAVARYFAERKDDE